MAAEGLLRLSFCNILTGELLAEVQLAPTDSLQAAATAQLPDLLPFRLLHNDEPLAEGSVASLGLKDGDTVNVVRLQREKKFRQIGELSLLAEGYHCHDTYIKRVASQDPDCFYVAWERRFQGKDGYKDSFPRRADADPKDRTSMSETVMVDLARCAAEAPAPVTTQRGCKSSESSESSGVDEEADVPDLKLEKYIRRVHQCPRPRKIGEPLAVSANGAVYATARENEICFLASSASDPQPRYQDLPASHLHDALFVENSLFVIGSWDSDTEWSDAVQELKIAEDGSMSKHWQHTVTSSRESCGRCSWKQHNFGPQFLGLDPTGEAIWFATEDGLYVLCLDTRAVSACCMWQDVFDAAPKERVDICEKDIAFDLHARQLYLLCNASLLKAESAIAAGLPTSSCHVRCLMPERRDGGRPWDVTYPNLPGEVVSSADFGIDGFSDAFCVSASHFLPNKRQIMVLDADGGLWTMQL